MAALVAVLLVTSAPQAAFGRCGESCRLLAGLFTALVLPYLRKPPSVTRSTALLWIGLALEQLPLEIDLLFILLLILAALGHMMS